MQIFLSINCNYIMNYIVTEMEAIQIPEFEPLMPKAFNTLGMLKGMSCVDLWF